MDPVIADRVAAAVETAARTYGMRLEAEDPEKRLARSRTLSSAALAKVAGLHRGAGMYICDSWIPKSGDEQMQDYGRMIQHWRARSRLYRSRFLRVIHYFAAFFEICKMQILVHLLNPIQKPLS